MRTRTISTLAAVALGLTLASAGGAAPAAQAARCPGAGTVPRAGGGAKAAGAVLCLLNRERARRHLSPLRRDRRLALAARAHSRAMVTRGFFTHDGPFGDVVARLRRVGYIRPRRAWTVGENIAWGNGGLARPAAIMRSWMSSPGHRANILQPGFRDIGVGVALGSPGGRDGGVTYTQDFGSRGRR